MFFKFKPLSLSIVEKALRNLRFTEEKGKAMSHRQFKKFKEGRLYKVTLDSHRGQVSAVNVKSIIKQARTNKYEFYKAAQGKLDTIISSESGVGSDG